MLQVITKNMYNILLENSLTVLSLASIPACLFGSSRVMVQPAYQGGRSCEDSLQEDRRPELGNVMISLERIAMGEYYVHSVFNQVTLDGIARNDLARDKYLRRWSAFLDRPMIGGFAEQYERFEGGRFTGISQRLIDDPRLRECGRLVAFYWRGSQGVLVDLYSKIWSLIRRPGSFKNFFWPHYVFGYEGHAPLKVSLDLALKAKTVSVEHVKGGCLRIRFPSPFDSGEDPVWHQVLLAKHGGEWWPVSSVISRPQRGILTERCIDEWTRDPQGKTVPSTIRCRFSGTFLRGRSARPDPRVDGGFVQFHYKLSYPEKIAFDARAMLEALPRMGRVRLGKSLFVSISGMQDAIEEAAVAFFKRSPAKTEPKELPEILGLMGAPKPLARGERGAWPPLQEVMFRGLVAKEFPAIDTSLGYCGQASLAMWARLQGCAVPFSELLELEPAERLSLLDLVGLGKRMGLQLVVKRLSPSQVIRIKGPFLLVRSVAADANHLVVVERDSQDEFRWWEPPSRRVFVRDLERRLMKLGMGEAIVLCAK